MIWSSFSFLQQVQCCLKMFSTRVCSNVLTGEFVTAISVRSAIGIHSQSAWCRTHLSRGMKRPGTRENFTHAARWPDTETLSIPWFAVPVYSYFCSELSKLTLLILQGPSILTLQFYNNTTAMQTTLTRTANNQTVLQRNRGWEAQRTSADLVQPALPIE